MQISTVHKWQKAFDITLETLKFVWLNAFLIGMGSIVAFCVIFGNCSLIQFIDYIFIAVAFDWFKNMIIRELMNLKNSGNKKYYREVNNSNNMFYIGSANWNSNPAKIGSLAYSMNQMSRSSNYYN